MTTPVEVDEDAKSRLEELQAEIRRQTGRRVTQQALLSRLIEESYASRATLIDSFRQDKVPLSADEIAQMQRGRIRSGEHTDDDIDDILY